MLVAALPRAIALRSGVAMAKPKSWSIPPAPLAIPIRCLGTVLTLTAVADLTARANPVPARTMGSISAATDTGG
jgi:hypothetical protein